MDEVGECNLIPNIKFPADGKSECVEFSHDSSELPVIVTNSVSNSLLAEELPTCIKLNEQKLTVSATENAVSEDVICAPIDTSFPNEESHSSSNESTSVEKSSSNRSPSDTIVGSNNLSVLFSNDEFNVPCDSNGTVSRIDSLVKTSTVDSLNEAVNYPSVFSDCASLEKLNYSVDFTENVAKIEKNNLLPSDLISSETMSDFFDEIYDANYMNRLQHQKIEKGTGELLNNFSRGEVGGVGKKQDWNVCFDDSKSSPFAQVDSDVKIKSSLKRLNEIAANEDYPPCKKPKKGITFDSVSVYYFPRIQGFTCIPSQGGSTLGMSWNHSHIRKFSLGEHAAEQRRAHRQLCSQQLSASQNWSELSNVSSEDSDSDEIMSDSEVDYENYNFLQPIPTRERRAMLRAAGVHKIDSLEKDECRSIRLSREFCGCTCQIYCDPERCVCAQAGIKCQVDRMNFPCSCSRDGCANENGRIEFNPVRVRTHYIHTLMRLEMEKKKEENEEHNRLMLSNLENTPHLLYSSALPSSSGCDSNILSTFSYNNLSYYSSQPSPYDVSSSTTSSELSSQSFGYGNQYMVATAPEDSDVASYSQLSSVSSIRVLDASNSSNTLTTVDYSLSGECLRLGADYEAGSLNQLESQNFPSVSDLVGITAISPSTVAADAAATSTYDEANSFIRLSDDNLKQSIIVECQSEGDNLDMSAEMSEETEKEESDSENFGDIIKKTMVESVTA